MMINWGSNYRRIINESNFKYLYQNRAIITGTHFDIAFSKRKLKGVEWRQSQNFAILGTEKDLNNTRHFRRDSYIIGLSLNRVLFRVTFWPDPQGNVNPRESRSMECLFPRDEPIKFDHVPVIDSFETIGLGIVTYLQ